MEIHMDKIFLLLSLLMLWAVPAVAGPTLYLKDGAVVLKNAGKTTVLPEGPSYKPQKVSGSDMFFLGTNLEAKERFGLEQGLYLFDKTGKMIAFAPSEAAEFCADVSFSPTGNILAMDSGATLVRSNFFFSYPSLKPMGEIVFYQLSEKPSFFWNNDTGILFSSMQVDNPGRACGYDPCGPVSVEYHSFKDSKTTSVMAGTPECDYTIAGFDAGKGVVSIDKLCLPSADAWKKFPENVPPQTITVPLSKN